MQTKKCFKCGRELPIAEFYNHPQMLDGHLNKARIVQRRMQRFVMNRSQQMKCGWKKKESEGEINTKDSAIKISIKKSRVKYVRKRQVFQKNSEC